jgi:hypothetical protein
MYRTHRLLAAGALMAGTAGIVLAAMPAPPRTDPVTPLLLPAAPAARPASAASADSLVEEIVLANVFAADRMPPASRYTPPELMVDPVTNGMAVEAGDGGTAGAPEPLLFGTVVRGGAAGSLALLQIDHTAAGPRLYRPGDRDGPWRVLAIAAREVILSGPGGRVVLRLPSSEDRP